MDPAIVLLLLSFLHLCQTRSPTYEQCQLKKPCGISPLEGCPDGTLFVSQNDDIADFTSIQAAIDSLSPDDNKTAIILISEGSYHEVINVTRSAPLTLLGQLELSSPSNLVQIWDEGYRRPGIANDDDTATLLISPVAKGAFGSPNFRAYNIDIENRAANYAIAQAVAVSVHDSNASFYGCNIASYQDAWYTEGSANTYVTGSTIYGEVDYLFGSGAAFFQSVTLANRGCGGGITAWQGIPGTTKGVYILDSRIIRSSDANATTVTEHKCYLGRPWNEYAVAVFIRNYMDDSINPAGYTAWNESGPPPNTTFYAESGSYGPGGNMSCRVPEAHILSDAEAARYTLEYVFGEVPEWIDCGYEV